MGVAGSIDTKLTVPTKFERLGSVTMAVTMYVERLGRRAKLLEIHTILQICLNQWCNALDEFECNEFAVH